MFTAVKASTDKISKAKTVSKKSKDVKLKSLTEHDLSVVSMSLYICVCGGDISVRIVCTVKPGFH